ncbi:hypothetical protein [Salinarimonas sp.]|uniref:hypothetical protein n=1 Tax=Salinarimonas sp. TaxID=2766526 RepID=UPI0032D93213
MRSLIIGLAAAGVAAGAAQAQAIDVSPAAGRAIEDAVLIPLSRLDFDPVDRDLWSAMELLGADVLGPGDEDIGDVEDILVGVDGYALAVVVELDEFLEFDETMLSVPFSVLEPLPAEGLVRSPIDEEGLQMYAIFEEPTLTADTVSNEVTAIAENDLDAVLTGSDVFLLEDLMLGMHAPLDGETLGYVHDVLFTMEGALEAVVVSATRDPFADVAVPYTGGTAREESVLEAAPLTAEEMGVRD